MFRIDSQRKGGSFTDSVRRVNRCCEDYTAYKLEWQYNIFAIMEKIRTIRKGYFAGVGHEWAVGGGGGIGRGLKASLIAHSQIEYISYMFSQTRGATKSLHFHGTSPKMTPRNLNRHDFRNPVFKWCFPYIIRLLSWKLNSLLLQCVDYANVSRNM